ncbi:hypothetical protein Mapa_013169 [Marchantia paleacea]|nr:hypothetical protein Mapa_013169 [Marchantia paleacea]
MQPWRFLLKPERHQWRSNWPAFLFWQRVAPERSWSWQDILERIRSGRLQPSKLHSRLALCAQENGRRLIDHDKLVHQSGLYAHATRQAASEWPNQLERQIVA